MAARWAASFDALHGALDPDGRFQRPSDNRRRWVQDWLRGGPDHARAATASCRLPFITGSV
jgi:hypothetical protein